MHTNGTTLDFADADRMVGVDLLNSDSWGAAWSANLTGVVDVLGSAHNDVLIGDGNDNTFLGRAGNDTLVGGAGADLLDGGAGVDRASYSDATGGVYISLDRGTAGGAAEGDQLVDIENLTGSGYADALAGDDGTNDLQGGRGADELIGLGGDDFIHGGDGDDYISGGAGGDEIFAGDGADIVDGGAGFDVVNYAGSDGGVRIRLVNNVHNGHDANGDDLRNIEGVTGSEYDDLLAGDHGDNVLTGGAGNDEFIGLSGGDSIYGGAGIDTVNYEYDNAPVRIRLYNNVHNGEDARDDYIVGVENIQGSPFDDVLAGTRDVNEITGGEGDDSLWGLAGDDILSGGAGDDTLRGQRGADRLDGGAGNDTATYADSHTGVFVQLWDNAGHSGQAAGDTLHGIENLTGSAHDDGLVGDDGDNVLQGGAGADRLNGGKGIDTASYADADSGVFVQLWDHAGHSGEADGDTLQNIENLIGSEHADGLVGDGGANVFDGGAGGDRFNGGGGNDTVSYASAESGVTALLHERTGYDGDAEGDTFADIENLTGSSGNDVLAGEGGANRISGGDGDDFIEGRQGPDVLIGGAGDDLFVFNQDDGIDTIMDFDADGDDRLDLTALGLNDDFETFHADHVADQGDSTAVDLGGGHQVDLLGLSAAALTADDVLL